MEIDENINIISKKITSFVFFLPIFVSNKHSGFVISANQFYSSSRKKLELFDVRTKQTNNVSGQIIQNVLVRQMVSIYGHLLKLFYSVE